MKKQDIGLLIIRASLGILIILHGIDKLVHGIDGIWDMLESKGIPGFFAYGVYVGEVIAPFLMIIGFRTRLASLLLFINMLVIVLLAHPNDLFLLTDHGGWKLELAGLFLFGSLAVIFTGGGGYALSSSNRWD